MLYTGPEYKEESSRIYKIGGVSSNRTDYYGHAFDPNELKIINITKNKLEGISANFKSKNISMVYTVSDKDSKEVLLHKVFDPVSEFLDFLSNNSFYKGNFKKIILEIELVDKRKSHYDIMNAVWFDGWMYLSLINNNVFSPKKFPYGWEKVEHDTPLYEELLPRMMYFEETPECNRAFNELELSYKRKAERLIDWDKF